MADPADEQLYKRLTVLEGDVARQGATLDQVVNTLNDLRNELKAARQPWTAVLSAGAAGVGIILLIVSQWTGNVAAAGAINSKEIDRNSEIVRHHQIESAASNGRFEERFETLKATLTNEITRRQDTERYLIAETKEAKEHADSIKHELDQILQREMRLLDEILQREMQLRNQRQDAQLAALDKRFATVESEQRKHDQEVRGINGDQSARIRSLEKQVERAREDPFTGKEGASLERRLLEIEGAQRDRAQP